jgi:hypothetical protein
LKRSQKINVLKFYGAISHIMAELKTRVSEIFCVWIFRVDPYDGDRGSLWNVGFLMNHNVANCPTRF